MSSSDVIDPHSWADAAANQARNDVSSRGYSDAAKTGLDDGSPKPNVLRYDEKRLKEVSESNELPKRPCSIYFNCDKSSFVLQSFLQDVKKIGICLSSVLCIQEAGRDGYIVSFKTPDECRLFSEKSSYIRRSIDHVYSVSIYDAPFEMPDAALIHRLSYYGDVKKLYRRTYSGYGNLQTGVRTAKMTIYDKLPSFLRFGETRGQPLTALIALLPAGLS